MKIRKRNFGSDYTITLPGLESFRSGHLVIYLTATDIWTDNPIIGNGIKSFRIKCWTKLHLPNRTCSSHPHNYYLEKTR